MGTRIVCAGLIQRGENVVLVQEAKPRVKGLWSLPAGRLEQNDETLESCAQREISEEAGVQAEIQGVVGVYIRLEDNKRDVIIVYSMSVENESVNASYSDVQDAKWVNIDTINSYELRSKYILKAIQDSEKRELIPCSAVERVGES